MRKRWNDPAGAAERLRAVESERPKVMRFEAQEIPGMSAVVFASEVLSNPRWIARHTEAARPGVPDGKTAAVARDFERMRDKRECARLTYDYYYLSDQAFIDEYGKPKDVVFAPGTSMTLTIGGDDRG